jgi:hypothetical protein
LLLAFADVRHTGIETASHLHNDAVAEAVRRKEKYCFSERRRRER